MWSAYCEPRERKITANLHGRVGTSARRSDVPSDCGRLSVEAPGQQQGMGAGASGSQASARGSPPGFKILAIVLRCSLSELGCLAGSQEISRRSCLRDQGVPPTEQKAEVQGKAVGRIEGGSSPLQGQCLTVIPSGLHSGAISTLSYPPRFIFSSSVCPFHHATSLTVAPELFFCKPHRYTVFLVQCYTHTHTRSKFIVVHWLRALNSWKHKDSSKIGKPLGQVVSNFQKCFRSLVLVRKGKGKV